MNKQLEKAMIEEKAYVADRMNGIDTSLKERLVQYGYDTLDDYFKDKKKHLWDEWKPEVRRTDISIVSQVVEEAIKNEDYGVYIPTVSGVYAFHGENGIDKELCENLKVRPVNMGYRGGIIIGSEEDFAIEILMPAHLNVRSNEIIAKFAEIIGKYIPDVTIDGNDILVASEKIMGSMERHIGNVYVWAAQISFGDYEEYISKICKKPSVKKPSRIDRGLLSKDKLEKEVLKWLRKL